MDPKKRDTEKPHEDATRVGPNVEPTLPGQPTYGHSENLGSPGGDEPPAGSDAGKGTPGDAAERH